jgi:hypothetical protein
MQLITAQVGPFKSISSPQNVRIDPEVTVFVGMNEAGKTVFLQALEKSRDALGIARFNPVDDYPRKDLPAYLKRQTPKPNPERATSLTYRLTDDEVAELNRTLKTEIPKGFVFSVNHRYDNEFNLEYEIDEKPMVEALASIPGWSSDAIAAIKKSESLRVIPEALKSVSLTEKDTAFLASLQTRITKATWGTVADFEFWEWARIRVPRFLYFSDYDLLPSKINLTDLATRVEQAKADPKLLAPKHRAVLALLRMASISISDFTTAAGGYEALKAKIEGVSINLTDQIMEFWKQNEDLEVEIDIKPDPHDEAPFNNGPNLYLRIKNRRHRGASTPFAQRSRGFIWFFSFLVWFDSVVHQIDTVDKRENRIILLLDEPGLALHAMAQADFLRYIDRLSKKHQVIYTTHSPFMVHSDRLHQVRVVEDKDKIGTVISDNVEGSDPRTIFPLQAALGWTIAQNLFISKRNLLVEGPSELIYLKAVSARLEAAGREGLRVDVTIVPVGGLNNLVTFIALLGASGLEMAVLHDHGAPIQKLADLAKQKLIPSKALLNVAQFRDPGNAGPLTSSDIEDLFDPSFYLEFFNQTFSQSMPEADLPPGDRIVERLERCIEAKALKLRPSGGFNHYLVASHFASNPPAALSPATLDRFEALFKAVNQLF